MTKDTKRTVSYTLQSRATGMAGLDRFYKSLEQILTLQEKLKAQGDVVAGLRAQAQESITAAQREAQAARETVRVKRQANNDYAAWWKSTLASQEQAERRAHQEGMQRLRDRAATVKMNARFQQEAEQREQAAINATIRALGNQQRSMRDLWQAGKTTGADIVTQQREIQKAALEAAGALKRESDEYRKLTSIAAASERTINSATGKLTPGGFAHGVVQGIQGSGLFTQLAAMGGLGSTAQNLGIVASGFTTAKKAALDFGNASNTAATASGFLAGGLNALGLALVAAGAGLVALGRTGMQELATLERGLNTLQANGVQNLGEVRSNIRTLKDELGNVGKTLSEADLTAASSELVKANLSVADSLLVLAPAAKLAAAENTNLNAASAQLLMNTRQYNLDVSQSGRVADMFAKAGNLAAGTANDLSLGFGKVGGTGLQAKIAMNDLLGMLVELDLKGMSAADVGADALRTALSSLADPSEKAQGIFKELNIELEDNQGKARPAGDILADLGQKMRGMGITVNKATGELQGNGEALRTVSGLMDTRAAAAIINLTGDWREHGKAIQDSEGYATEYANTMSQGATQAMARFRTSLKDAGLALVENFAEPLSDLLDNVITPGAEKIGEWLRGLKGLSDMGEISLALKIKASDDASDRFLKLIASGVVGAGEIIVRIVEGANANAAAADKQANDLVQAYELSKLQVELVKYGILPREMNPFKQLEQSRMIAANEASFRAQLVTAMNQAVAAITGRAPTIQPLKGQGPLLPGQSRDLGVGLGSADTITRMDPAFQQQIGKALMQYVAQNAGGLIPYIHEGYRSQERQAQLYAQGRTAPGPIVTNAKPGQSIHNYGMAADIYWKDPKTGKVLSFNDPRALAAARSLGQIAVGQGLVWGGTPGWGGPVDLPHIQANLSWQEAARRAGGTPMNTPASTKPFTPPSSEALKAEARRILTAIQKAERDGDVDGKTAADNVLKAFIKSGPRAAAAVEIMRDKLGQVRKETSQFGQQFDALKGKLTLADSASRLGENVLPTLKAIRAEALKAAETEQKRNGTTAKFIALRDLAADAEQKLQAIQNRKPEQTPLQREQAAQRERVAMEALEKSIRGANRARLDAIVKGGVTGDVSLAKWEMAKAEIERREKAASQKTPLQRDQEAQREIVAQEKLTAAIRKASSARLQAIVAGGVTAATSLEKWKAASAELERREEARKKQAEDQTAAVRKLREEYSRLAADFRKKIDSGTMTVEDLDEYWNGLVKIGQAGQAAGVSGNKFLQSAQLNAKALHDVGIDALVAAGAFNTLTDAHNRYTLATTDDLGTAVSKEGQRLLSALTNAGVNPDGSPDPLGLESALQDVTAFLASDLAQYLPQATRDALEQGVREAEGYRDALASITGEAITDGAREAMAAVQASPNGGLPTNQFQDLSTQLWTMGTDLKDPVKLQAVTEELDRARQAGELTNGELLILQGIIATLNATPLEILPTGDEARWTEWDQKLSPLIDDLEAGAITQKDFNKATADMIPTLERMAAAADKAGKPEVAQAWRDMAAALKDLRAGVSDTSDALKEQSEALIEDIEKWGKLALTAGKLFGQGDDSDFATAVNGAITHATLGVKAFTQFLAGDFVGMAQTTIEWIMNIGTTIENLSPGLKAWKKGLLEVAAAQREAMGSAKINTWLNNPYYDELRKDAEAREKLGNSNWMQRLGWDLFGGRPQHMDDATAKMKIEAAKAFASLGQDLATTLEDELMKGFESGSFDGVNASVDRKLDLFVAQTALRMVFAKSKLEDLLKAFAEEFARGGDTSDELAAIRTERDRITQEWASLAPSLPGYGSGADSGGGPGSSPAGDPVVGANFYVANSSKIDLFDNVIQRADAMYQRHEGVLARHSDVLSRHADVLERVMRDGIELKGEGSSYGRALRT